MDMDKNGKIAGRQAVLGDCIPEDCGIKGSASYCVSMVNQKTRPIGGPMSQSSL